MKVQNLHSNSTNEHITFCSQCNALLTISKMENGEYADCPRCHHNVESNNSWSLKRCAIIALSIIILMPFALNYPLLSVNLIGIKIDASIWNGVWKMATEGYPYTAFLIFLTAVFMPISFAILILLLQSSKLLGLQPRNLLIALNYIKPWVMFDVYLVALGVTAFKVRDYAELSFDIYLISFIAVALLTILLFVKLNPKQLWNEFYPEHIPLLQKHQQNQPHFCAHCDYTFSESILDSKGKKRCPRCYNIAEKPADISLQQTWAALLAGMIMLLPANIYPISHISMNNISNGDTLFSGVISFIDMGSYLVAFIVFFASIFVPFSKIVIMLYLLFSIHFSWRHSIKWQMRLFHIVHFVGRWSMLDLFVLALMMSLVTRGQIINFSVGPAAIYFGLSVFLTMLATMTFDSRLLWEIYDKPQSQPEK